MKAMLLNKFEDFNLIFAIIYTHNILLTRNNLLINNLLYNYNYTKATYIISILLISSSLTKSAQILFSV